MFVPHSVVIPTFNEEKLIESCQTVKPLEIIVVDGYSSDNTVALAKKYTNKIFYSNMRNIAYQRELGCSMASSNLILLADADTVFPPNWIEKAFRKFY